MEVQIAEQLLQSPTSSRQRKGLNTVLLELPSELFLISHIESLSIAVP